MVSLKGAAQENYHDNFPVTWSVEWHGILYKCTASKECFSNGFWNNLTWDEGTVKCTNAGTVLSIFVTKRNNSIPKVQKTSLAQLISIKKKKEKYLCL